MNFENTRRVSYGTDGEDECATFIPRCSKCSRFVKADESVKFDSNAQPVGDNATCSRCGRVQMIWEGYL